MKNKIKVEIRYGYDTPFLRVDLKNSKNKPFCKVKDFEHFDLWCTAKKALRSRGALIRVDRDIKKRSKCISQYYGYGNWNRLEFVTNIYQNGLEFEFFQNVTPSENRNGGRYDFNKYSKFPYLLKLRLRVAMKTIIESIAPLCEATIEFVDCPNNAVEKILNNFRKKSFTRSNINSIDEIETFMSGYDLSQNNNDRDKRKINCGDVKYFYSYDGYLHRGKVYHNINNMWWVIENETTLRNIASFELFDRTDEPIRRVLSNDMKLKKLKEERSRQIDKENFIRCNKIQIEINRIKKILG